MMMMTRLVAVALTLSLVPGCFAALGGTIGAVSDYKQPPSVNPAEPDPDLVRELDRMRRVEKTIRRLERETGASPDDQAIALALGVSLDEYQNNFAQPIYVPTDDSQSDGMSGLAKGILGGLVLDVVVVGSVLLSTGGCLGAFCD